ncbi:hypothetical protein [Lichenifustis flavocetrariae]|uniref:Uncharacterized protein n=1 Tax=Lichenifustis flavocetrariae TaxID=2949735 RepID=A0AA42CNX6_9HYPH|nr:hypothetical protein [Lichenifustis flavocetrariae]MCW6509857.1 hypothetical protein [Lichenifustis flavocetrariae]
MPDARFTVDGAGRAMSPLWHFVHGCRAEGIRPDEPLQAYLGHWSMTESLPPVVEAATETERWARVRVGVTVMQSITAVRARLHDEMLFRFWEWTTGQPRTPEVPGEGDTR